MVEESTKIGVFNLNGVPVFVTPGQLVESQRVFGATFLKDRCLWVFPAFPPFLEDVLNDFNVALPRISFSETAQKHIEAARGAPGLADDFVFVTKPFDHQREGLDFLIRNLRAALFYDCGLGKTKIIVDLLRCEKGKALVLAPATALRVWEREIDKHAPKEFSVLRLKPASKKERLKLLEGSSTKDILLLSYDSAPKYWETIVEKFKYRSIVADESHYLGDVRSLRTKAALVLADRAARRVIVSGTPTLGNPLHLYGQLSFLGRYLPAKDYRTFQRYYLMRKPMARRYMTSQGIQTKEVQIVVGYKNLDMLNRKISKVALRKTAAECLDLPKRTIMDAPFNVSTEQKRVYNNLVKNEISKLDQEVISSPENVLGQIQKLLQILSGFYIHPFPNICDGCEHVKICVEERATAYTKACRKQQTPPPRRITRFKENGKLNALEDLLNSILEEARHKVIIWCHFLEELAIVEELLKAKDWAYVRIDGSNSKDAETYAKRFNEEETPRVWLAQIATGISLTLNRAVYAVYFGIGFSLGAYLQSVDRNYRIGQTNPTFVYRFNYEGSLLEVVWAALQSKIDLSKIITTRIRCVSCNKVLICLGNGTEPFKEGCIYSSRAVRVVAKPRLLY